MGHFLVKVGDLGGYLGFLLGCLAVLGEAAWLLLGSCLAAVRCHGRVRSDFGDDFDCKMGFLGTPKCG